MPDNAHDDIFERHIYVPREADNDLGTIVESFIRGQRPMRWVSVQAPKGSGRTLMLERLRRLKAELTERDILRIFVRGRSSRVEPLNPLAGELYALRISDQQTVKGWLHSKTRELKRRLSNSSWQQLVMSVLVVVACLLLTCILVGLGEYATAPEGSLATLHGWRAFFTSYLPNHGAKFPLWFLIASSVGFPLSLAALYLSRNGLLPAPSELEGPRKKQIQEFATHEGLQSSLFELLAERRRILLFADDAHRLPPVEQEFLHSLFVPEVRDAFEKKKWRMLIVTVDDPEMDRKPALHKQMHTSFKAVQVSHFELVDLQAIVDSQLPELAFQSDEERLSLLEQAQADVNALFASRNRQLIHDMGGKFEENDIDGEFTPAKLLAYRLARRDRFISKTVLTKWMNRFSGEDQLRIFEQTKSESDQALVINLAKSNLVETRGQTIVFEAERAEALREWLKQNNSSLWQQTHYYWFKTALGQIDGTRPVTEMSSLSSDEQTKLRMGTWHALQLVALKAVPTLLTQAPGLASNELQRLCEEAATLLRPAIVMARSEGDFEKADALAWNAREWLRTLAPQMQITALDWIAHQLWRSYSHSGNPDARKKLEELATSFPDLTTRTWWPVYQALDDWRKGSSVYEELPPEAALTDPDHQNLRRLVVVLRGIKQNHGFLSSALEEADFTIPEPATGGSDVLVELELYALLASALNKRNETERLMRVLEAWRRRLMETAPPDDLLGDKAVHLYHTARYWHVLTDTWELQVNGESAQVEGQESTDVNVAAKLQSLFLPAQTQFQPSTIGLSREAENAYEHARRLSVLLGWKALLLHAGFHLGVLLADYQLEKWDPDKWEWDKLFWQVLQLETQFGWFINAPTIHKIRWERVYPLDRELSIEDAYNVYKSLIKGGYATALVAEWHKRTAGLLNDYGRDNEDRQRSAELYEQWARKLASDPAARTFWRYKKLTYEQAHGLLFAAQAQRGLERFETAERLLNEAEMLLRSSSVENDGDDAELRYFQLSIELQRAWLLNDQKTMSAYGRMIRAIWRKLKFGDAVLANVLGSLLSIEAAEGLLETPWPPADTPVNVDPENDALSLPVEWFDGDEPIKVQNLFDFRFRQLLRTISDKPAPTTRDLTEAATWHWGGQDKFAEVAIYSVKTAAWIRHSEELEPLLLNVLETVRAYFSQVEGVDRRELEALRLLMQYKTTAKKYRDTYIKVLLEFETLVEREKRVREMSEPVNWPSVALWASTHLWLLVDNAVMGQYLAANNQPIEESLMRREQLVTVLQEATRKYEDRQITPCLVDLEKIRFAPGQFVLIEDILALDLWLKCKQQNSETQTDEFNLRARQLREAVIQYVTQLSAMISEQQVQLLALNMLADLRQADAKLRAAAQ